MIPIPLPVIIGLGAAAVGIATGWTMQGWRAEARIEAVRTELAAAKGEHAKAAANAASAALAQSEAHRATEAAMRRAVETANASHAKDKAALVAARARADSDAGSLRVALNAIHCAAPSGTPGDTRTPSGDATAPLGDVLDGLLQDYRAATAAAEAHASDLRAVLASWPRVTP